MSYTRFLYHIVFRTKNSEKTINQQNERLLYKYLYTFMCDRGCHVYRIGGMEDHIHILADIPPIYAISDFMREMKSRASHFMRNSPAFPHWNGWALGYAALTYGKDELKTVCKYIKNQKEHHRRHSMNEEVKKLITDMGYDTSDFRIDENK